MERMDVLVRRCVHGVKLQALETSKRGEKKGEWGGNGREGGGARLKTTCARYCAKRTRSVRDARVSD